MVSSSPRLKTVVNGATRNPEAREEVVDFPDRKSSLPAEYAADPFLIPSEIAKWESVDPKTVSRWIKKGKFGGAPHVITLPGGTHRRVRQSAYEAAKAEVVKRYND